MGIGPWTNHWTFLNMPYRSWIGRNSQWSHRRCSNENVTHPRWFCPFALSYPFADPGVPLLPAHFRSDAVSTVNW
ncbi:hypothetical protein OUZ56_033182 [Daphnia magna]|uniref:Uncharacterized protein n=1 Tax=Daphnia magna TaxID=35525 RepID=A0ABR0BAF3_9CRUS|nr:hypothetical protein OUZ56_033182 [Daphnia magna]